MLITKLDVLYDAARLWDACLAIIAQYGWGPVGQINLTHRPDCDPAESVFEGTGRLVNAKERDFSVLNEVCRDTYIEEVVSAIPYELGRLRIMRVKGRTCYSVHRDTTQRVHLPMVTNPQALMLFPDHGLIVNLPVNGHVYLTDTTERHTAMNGSLDDRYHLVGALKEK